MALILRCCSQQCSICGGNALGLGRRRPAVCLLDCSVHRRGSGLPLIVLVVLIVGRPVRCRCQENAFWFSSPCSRSLAEINMELSINVSCFLRLCIRGLYSYLHVYFSTPHNKRRDLFTRRTGVPESSVNGKIDLGEHLLLALTSWSERSQTNIPVTQT
jgi:hypothetical protein